MGGKKKGAKVRCKTCGKIFAVSKYRKHSAKYCSKDCLHNSKTWKNKVRKAALKALEKINKKWKLLKKMPALENCLAKRNNKILFDNLRWIKKSNYLERIKLTPKIIEILGFSTNEKTISIKYKHFNPHYGEFRSYERTIPRYFSFSDNDFCYFLGLWVGDRMRVGISNSNKELLKFTKNFLENNFKQPQELILGEILYTKEVDEIRVKEAETFIRTIGITKIRKRIDKGGHLPTKTKPTLSYNICLSNNYILFHILSYLKKNLWVCTKIMKDKSRLAFYAGIIDAEAHIDPTHNTIDIYQNDNCFIDSLAQQLATDGFTVKPKEKSVRIYLGKKYETNINLAKKLLLQLKNQNKITALKNIFEGNLVKNSYVLIANWIKLFPNRTTSEITKKFGQNKTYFGFNKLTQLTNQGFIKRRKTEKKGEFRYSITEKGLEWVGDNKKMIEEKLAEIVRDGQVEYGMFSLGLEAIKELLKESQINVDNSTQIHNSN